MSVVSFESLLVSGGMCVGLCSFLCVSPSTFPNIICGNDFSFFIERPLHFCWKSTDHNCNGLFLDSLFCSVDLCLSLCHTTLCWLLSWFCSKFWNREVNPPTLFLILKVVLTILGPLHFHTNLGISWSTSRTLTDDMESVDLFRQSGHLDGTKSSNLWMWDVFPHL